MCLTRHAEGSCLQYASLGKILSRMLVSVPYIGHAHYRYMNVHLNSANAIPVGLLRECDLSTVMVPSSRLGQGHAKGMFLGHETKHC